MMQVCDKDCRGLPSPIGITVIPALSGYKIRKTSGQLADSFITFNLNSLYLLLEKDGHRARKRERLSAENFREPEPST